MVVCPKCHARGSQVYLVELWKSHSIDFEQSDTGVLSPISQNMGDPYKVQGHCFGCEHIWTLRGKSQITDLDKESD